MNISDFSASLSQERHSSTSTYVPTHFSTPFFPNILGHWLLQSWKQVQREIYEKKWPLGFIEYSNPCLLPWIFGEVFGDSHAHAHDVTHFLRLLTDFSRHRCCLFWPAAYDFMPEFCKSTSTDVICWIHIVLGLFLSCRVQENQSLLWSHTFQRNHPLPCCTKLWQCRVFLGWVIPRSHQGS